MTAFSRRVVLSGALQALMTLVFWNPVFGQSPDAPPPETTEPQSVQPARPPIGMTGGVIAAGPRTIVTTMGHTPTIRQVTGKPYFLELESEQSQTLADGTHISRKTGVRREYRDSLGRTRTEHELASPGHAANTVALIQIADPVARFRYTLNTRDKVAHRVPATVLPTAPNRAQGHPLRTRPVTRVSASPSATPPDNPRPQMKQEPLGTQTFDGVVADGFRMTTTMPVGYMGNDRPIESVCENWTSHELGMMVMSKCSDPRSGERTTRLTRVEMSEPDPSLFRVPAGYKVVKDMTPWYKRALGQ
jgi:hypothetical protein